MNLAYLNGEIMNLEDAKIPVTSIAFTLGGSVFEAIRVNWSCVKEKYYIPNIKYNIQRLYSSARLLRMHIEYTSDDIIDIIKELVSIWGHGQNGYIRITAYIKDSTPGGSVYDPSMVKTDLCVTICDKDFDIDIKNGIKCCISNWCRISDNSITPRAKSACNYQNTRLAGHQAILDGFDNAILLNQNGKVSEAAESSVFMIDKNNDLVTPSLTEGVLDSINRKLIITLWEREYNRAVIERIIDRTELYLAKEIFICNTAKMIRFVNSIDHYDVNDGKIGEYTRRIIELYIKAVLGEDVICEKESLWVDISKEV